jgi:uncharacterized protein YeaO (DUF488 family)
LRINSSGESVSLRIFSSLSLGLAKAPKGGNPMLKVKRVYEPPSREDGKRILIDRLWPRGLKKEEARVDEWLRDLAPSTELRKWYGHDPAKWTEFKKRYKKELDKQSDLLERIKTAARKGTVTLVFAAKDSEHCNAAALKEMLGEKRKKE